jgi:tetratricopeptide (TPR) repeat protein
MKRQIPLSAALAGVCLLLVTATGCDRLRARDNLNKGVQAYKNSRYPDAVEFFKTAVNLDPTFATARLYLATAYMAQYIPGVESDDNKKVAVAAHEEFVRVLEQDPKNSVAIASIASLFFNQKKMEDAEKWYRKLIEVDPQNKEAYYTLGVIAWTKSFAVRAEARAKLGMKPEEKGPLKDKKVRAEVKEKNWAIVESGLASLKEALKIDPEYDDAMAYQNLLYRERADLQDTDDDYKKDIDEADAMVQKTLATKKKKAAAAPTAQGIHQ